MTLDMNEYQRIAMSTAIYRDKVVYPSWKLAGEAGEVNEKLGKFSRDKYTLEQIMTADIEEDDRLAIAKELGDVLWYIAALARDFGFTLDDIARINISKLAKRKEEGKIGGSGDNR